MKHVQIRNLILLGLLAGRMAMAQAPAITSVTNGANGAAPPLAPGSIAQINGTNLASSSVYNSTLPASTSLSGTSVTVNGVSANLVYVSATAVRLQIPYETVTGGSATVIVNNNGTTSNSFSVPIATAAPGIWLFGNQDNSTNSATNPAPAGSNIAIYYTGAGATTPSVPDGSVNPSSPLAVPNVTPTVTVNGVSVMPSQVNMAPQTANVILVNAVFNAGVAVAYITVPVSLAAGSYPVVVTAGGNSSAAGTLYVGTAPVAISSNTALGTWNTGTQQIALAASGGNYTYTWSLVSGTLPPGLTLRTDVPSSFTSSQQAGLIGVATTPGTYTFTLSVTSAGQSAQQTFTIKMSALNVADRSSTLPYGYAGNAYTPYQLTAVNNAGPVTFTPNGSLPSGMTLSSSGVLSGTPTAAGSYSINLGITDGTDTFYYAIGFTVYKIDITTSALLPNATQNAVYTPVTLTATGGTAPYTWSGNLPSGLTLNSATGVISGTPTSGATVYNFTLTATDANSVSTQKNMSLTVIGAPVALPRITISYVNDAVVGNPYSQAYYVCCGGTAPFTWTATGLPPGLMIRSGLGNTSPYVNPGGVEIWGIPTTVGAYNIKFTVTDATGVAVSETVPMNVSALDSDYPQNGTISTAYSQTIRVLGGTGPYTNTAVAGNTVSTVLPDGLSLSGFTLSGTPLETGTFNLYQRYADSAGNTLTRYQGFSISGNGTTTISISNGSSLGPYVVGTSPNVTLTACCVPTYTWTKVSGTLPTGQSLSSAGVLSGTLSASGTYTFLVKVADASNANNYAYRQITETVTPITISSTTLANGNVGTAYSQTLTATGGTGTLTWAVTGYYLPPGLALSSAGVISGTPTSVGQYYFGVTATDSSGHTAVAYDTINIYAAGAAPPLNLTTGPNLCSSCAIGYNSFTLAATGGVPPYTFSYTPGTTVIPGFRVQSGQPLPTGFSSTVTAGLLGVATTAGTYSSSLRVTDSAGSTFDKAVTLTIAGVSVLTASNPPKAVAGTAYSYQFTPYGGSGNYIWSASGLSGSGLTLNATTGLLSGTPVAGTYSMNLTLADAAASTLTVGYAYTLTVNAFAITDSPILPLGTVGTAYSHQFAAPNCGTGCTWTLSSGSLPNSGTAFSLSSSGLLTGTYTGTAGFYGVFQIQAAGSAGTVQKYFTLEIPPTVTSGVSITNTITTSLYVGQTTQTTLTSSGGTPPYTWAVSSGSLPTGITLQGPGETLFTNSNPGFYYLAGRAMAAGTYTFSLTSTDSTGLTATKAFSWIVSPMFLSYTSLPISATPLILNTAYTQPMLVIGGSGTYTSFTTAAPVYPGLSVNSTTGTVSGTPTNTGSITTLWTVNDSAGNTALTNVSINAASSATATVTVSGGPALNLVFTMGGTTTYVISGSGGTAPYTISALGTLPAGFVLFNGNGITNGGAATSYDLTVSPQAPGTYTFTLQAVDASGLTGERTYSIIVPGFSGANTSMPDGAVGAAYSQKAVSFDSTSTATWTLTSSAPPGLTFSSAGVLSGTPTTAGYYSFSAILADTSGSVTYTISIHISAFAITTPGNLPSAITGVTYTTLSPLVTMAASGGTGLTWSASGLPAGLTMSPSGVITGTTTSSPAELSVTITVTDGVNPTSQVFSIYIQYPNTELDFVITRTSLADGILGRSYNVSLGFDGGVAPYTWALSPGSSLPPGLSLLTGSSVPGGGAPGLTYLAGVPTAAGRYTFSMTATDATGAQVTRTFTLNITPVALFTASPAAATVGVAYAQQLTAYGGTAPYTFALSPNTLVQDNLPPGLTLSSSGLLSGTPTATGTFSALLAVSDSAGHTYNTTLSTTCNNAFGLRVTTSNLNDSVGDWYNGGHLVTSGSSTYTWTVTSGTLPTGLTVSSAGVLSGWLAAPGTFHFTVRATDNANASNYAERALTWNISPMNITLPVSSAFASAALPPATAGTAYSYTFRVAGGTPPYTFAESPFNPLPPGLTMSAAGALSGTPTQSGIFPVHPVVTDSAGVTKKDFTVPLLIAQAGHAAPLELRNSTTGNGASLGVPYAAQLDRLVMNGTPPYSWSVTSGSLPTGLTIYNGSGGLPGYVSGTPTAAGSFAFTLTATDSAGETIAVPGTLTVGVLSLTPAEFPAGTVGSAYTATFSAAGGTSPYTLSVDQQSYLPPGLSLSGGALTGTPLYPGVYPMLIDLTDSAGNTLQRYYDLTIDDAAGESPAVSASPNPINIYYQQGNANPSLPISVSSTSGALAFTAGVYGLSGASLSSSSGSSGSAVTLNIAAGSLAVGSYSGLIAVQSATAANGGDAIPVTLTVAAPPPCSYTINPTSNSIPVAGGTGTFMLTTAAGCSWSVAVSNSSLISVTSATSGSGSATIAYTVPANTGMAALNGTITVGGQTYTVSEFGQTCSFAISPTSFSTVASGGTASISINSSGASCPWTASGLSVSPSSGTGSGSATVTIPANAAATTQTLTATIAGQTLTVTQTGVQCNVTLPASSATALVSGGAGSVAVTVPAGCTYSTVPGPSWLTITSGGSGSASGTLVYNVDPNSTTASRSGFLTIGGIPYQVTQPGISCSFTLNAAGLGSPFGVAGGTGTIAVNANGSNCPWTASSGSAFATVSPASGNGTGTVTVTASSNASSTSSRTGSLTVAGQNISFMQGGTQCAYMLRSSGATVPYSGGLGSISIVAPSACTWTAVSNNPSWLTLQSSSGGGTASVQFVAQPNTGGSSQTGTVTVAGQTFTVTEAAAPCSYALSSPSVTVGSPGVTNSALTVSTSQNGCSAGGAAVTSYANWITASNAGGTVTYSVSANPYGTTRLGTVQIGDQVFTVSESGAACAYSLSSYGAAFGELGGTGNLLGSPSANGCVPTVGTTQPSVITLGTISGPTLDIFTQPYTVSVFNSLNHTIRRATITFGGTTFTIKQTSW